MYSTHPSEFPSEPLPVMIDPTLLLFALLLLVIVGAGAYTLGQRTGHRAATDHGGKHREAIYKAIAKAADAAMTASRTEVMTRGEALHAAIQRRLGDVLVMGATIRAADDLRQALDGHGHATGHGGHGAGAAAFGPVIFNSGKLVMAKPGDGDDHPPRHDPADHGGGHGPLSHDETVTAVRRAIERFADHWSDKSARLNELRRAQIQLSPPR